MRNNDCVICFIIQCVLRRRTQNWNKSSENRRCHIMQLIFPLKCNSVCFISQDTELELLEQEHREQEMEEMTSGWNEVDIDTKPVNIVVGTQFQPLFLMLIIGLLPSAIFGAKYFSTGYGLKISSMVDQNVFVFVYLKFKICLVLSIMYHQFRKLLL